MDLVSKENNIFRLRDGRVLGYAEYGNPNGKPVFFFHGWPGSRFSGKETDEAGKKLGIRIISTDRPGIGLSIYKIDRKLLDWPDDVIELADYLKIKKFSLMSVSCVSLNMGKYYKSQIPKSELFIDPKGGHLSRYSFEEKILRTLTN